MEMMMRTAADSGKQCGRVVNVGFGYGFATSQEPSWSLDQVLLATGGRLLSGKAHACFRSIVTDSRIIKPGDLFLALSGERYDGACFAEDAVKNGAVGVISSRPVEVPVSLVIVDDTLQALGDLAAYRRSLLHDAQVLAVTGSSGKTTVKDMVACIMTACGKVIKTQENFNNLIGLPLSLLPMSYSHDFAVLEMGMNVPGEIARLTEIADPQVACINNVHPAHLVGLGNLDGVAKAKGELFVNSRSSTILVVNIDDPMVRRLARKRKNKKITFGRHKGAAVRATHIYNRGEQGTSFTLHIASEKVRVHLGALGEHNVLNGLAAAAMSWATGANMMQIATGLEQFTPEDKRLQLMDLANGVRVVNDSYNANPASMRAALTVVQKLGKGIRRIAVLGDMLELGEFSIEAHGQIGEAAARQGFDYLLAVGDYAKTMVVAARKAGMAKSRAIALVGKLDVVTLLEDLLTQNRIAAGDLVLLKGSRGMKMEEIVDMWEGV